MELLNEIKQMRNSIIPRPQIGAKFNRLTILEDLGVINSRTWVVAVCDCGVTKKYRYHTLKSSHTTSCGCYVREISKTTNITHGLRTNHQKPPLYETWASMKKRCNNPNTVQYKDYGGRGIKMCELWQKSFLEFRNWAMETGWSPGLEINRINNDGDYEPGNCNFVSRIENARNKRSNLMISWNGEILPLVVHCNNLGLTYSIVYERLRLGWTVNRAFTQKKKLRNNK